MDARTNDEFHKTVKPTVLLAGSVVCDIDMVKTEEKAKRNQNRILLEFCEIAKIFMAALVKESGPQKYEAGSHFEIKQWRAIMNLLVPEGSNREHLSDLVTFTG